MEIIFFKNCDIIYTYGNVIHVEKDMDILKKINRLRLERDWSIYRLSVESGISQSTLTNMFNRETLPSITTLECICNAFGISMSDFFKEATATESFDTEQELVDLYRASSDEVKASIMTLLRETSKTN